MEILVGEGSMKICVECKHFIGDVDGIWYDQYCGHPTSERFTRVDPVTGKEKYLSRNDLGNEYLSSEQWHHARDMNTSGKCPCWEKVDNE